MRIAIIALVLTSACTPLVLQEESPDPATSSIDDATGLELPDEDARTVEDFDTTSAEQRAEAASASAGGNMIGTTVATLGDAAQPGFWLETPLVDSETTGRVRNPASGRTVQVDLRPIDGGSSRISLAALRLLEAPLTELVTLEVFRN